MADEAAPLKTFAPPELITLCRDMLASGESDEPGFTSLSGFYLTSDAKRPAWVRSRLADLGL